MTETTYEKSLRLSREAKRRRTGTCSACGTETRYAGKSGTTVSVMCHSCAVRQVGESRRGSGDLAPRILDFLSEPKRYMEIRDHFALTGSHTGVLIQRLLRYGLIERVSRGVYVKAKT